MFYLSRDTEMYGGSYVLSTYHPQSSEHGMCWRFWPPKLDDFILNLDIKTANKLLNKLDKQLGFGECIELSTLKITNVK